MPVPAGGSPPTAPLVGPLIYDPVLSRVRLTATGLFDGVPVRVERSTNQVVWTMVRGGQVTPSAGQILVDDYEFAADVLNHYRVIGPSVWDTFTRTTSNGWNTADTGQVWTTSGGLASDFSVNGTQGLQSLGTVNVLRNSLIPVGSTNGTVTVDVTVPVVPTGAGISVRVVGRATDLANYYEAQLLIDTTGASTVRLWKRVATVGSSVSSGVSVGTHAAGNTWRITLDLAGTTLRAKAWKPASSSDPGWQQTATDTDLTAGTQAGVLARLESGNTNTLPVVIVYDNFVVPIPETTIYTGSITPILTGVWLKSIARPFLNRQVTVKDFSGVERSARAGVFEVVGRSFPVAVNDVRGSRRWTLEVLTQTLAEASTVDLVLASGDPLFVHVPTTCPVPGGYVTVGDTREERTQRTSNRRIFSMPCTEVAAPGPDVVGATLNWQTVLNTYATWADVIAAHPTWSSLLTLIGSPTDVLIP